MSNAVIIFAWMFETSLCIASLLWLCFTNACPPLLSQRWTRLTESTISTEIYLVSFRPIASIWNPRCEVGAGINSFLCPCVKRITCGRSEFIRSRASRDYNDLNLYPRANCCNSLVRLFKTLINLLVGDNETISHLRVFLYFYIFETNILNN